MKRSVLFLIICLLCAGAAFSVDFGLLAEQKFEWENDKTFTYYPLFTPWLSWDGGEGMTVYVSLHFPLKYKTSDNDADDYGWGEPGFKFEFSRTSFSYVSNNFSFEAGRVLFSDVLGVTAFGLLDGANFQMPISSGNLSAGLFYTGLLYKETAKILMTDNDAKNYFEPWDENLRYYFASRRLLGAGRFDMPLLENHNLSAEVLFQFDCNGEKDDWLHSQYVQGQVELFTMNRVGITAGAFFETMLDKDDFAIASGGLGILRVELPTPLNDGFKITSKYSSGRWNDFFAAFNPVSSQSQGEIFPEPFSGIWVNKLNYDVRILPSLFAEASVSYFIRTWTEPDNKDILYGGEFWAAVILQPLDDLRGSFGGGMFLPKTGNIYPDDTDPFWKIRVSVSLSF